jgi:hypothetical protein
MSLSVSLSAAATASMAGSVSRHDSSRPPFTTFIKDGGFVISQTKELREDAKLSSNNLQLKFIHAWLT